MISTKYQAAVLASFIDFHDLLFNLHVYLSDSNKRHCRYTDIFIFRTTSEEWKYLLPSSLVCSTHFDSECMGRQKLLKNALPSLM